MKVLIDIPSYEFNDDVKNKFQDYFSRVKQDIADGTLCGKYERETTDMFLASFKRLQVLPDNATNGDIIKAMFPNTESRLDEKTGVILVKWADGTTKTFKASWWNAPYKTNERD